jgi:predicted esterase
MLSAAKLTSVLGKLGVTAAASASVPELASELVRTWQSQSQAILRVNDSEAASATVIFSHGLGDTGDGWSMGFKYEVATHLPHVRFLFPTARKIPVTLNMGMKMPAWYDIPSLDKDRLTLDAEGIVDSVAYIHAIALMEQARLTAVMGDDKAAAEGASKRIVISGFSQGAALSYMAGHTYPAALGGIGALSGYLTARKELEAGWAPCNSATPLFTAHGKQDPVVPFTSGKESFELISKMKREKAAAGDLSLQFKPYSMQHESSPEEMRDFVAFLKQVIPPL